jgi:hypothetical protein
LMNYVNLILYTVSSLLSFFWSLRLQEVLLYGD